MSTRRRSAHYLSAAVVSGLVSFAALPLITTRLGPGAFGAVALVTAFVSLGNAFATLGSSFVVYRFLPEERAEDKATTISSLCLLAGLASVGWAMLVAVLFFSGSDFGGLNQVPAEGVFMGLGTMVLSPYWSIATDILILEGRSGLFASTTVVQALVGAAVTVLALFAFDAGLVSLFAGNLAGMLVLAAGAAQVLVPHLSKPSRASLRKVIRVALHNIAPQAAESGYLFAERLLLARFAGLRALGLYTHAQRYREIAQLGLKSVARGVWPVSLDEARDPRGDFAFTGLAWRGLYVVLTAAGIGAAAVGDLVISGITNGRFTDSYPLVAGWIVYVLIQNAARPQLAVLFSLGESDVVARVNLKANLAGLAALAVAIPLVGMWGGLAAGLLGIAVSRSGFILASRRYRDAPDQDSPVLVGVILIASTLAAKLWLDPSVIGSLILLSVAEILCLAWGGSSVLFLIRSASRRADTSRGSSG